MATPYGLWLAARNWAATRLVDRSLLCADRLQPRRSRALLVAAERLDPWAAVTRLVGCVLSSGGYDRRRGWQVLVDGEPLDVDQARGRERAMVLAGRLLALLAPVMAEDDDAFPDFVSAWELWESEPVQARWWALRVLHGWALGALYSGSGRSLDLVEGDGLAAVDWDLWPGFPDPPT